MSDLRRTISWLLLVLVAVVGLGGAVLGISLAPKNAPLNKAVANTLAASGYTQVLNGKSSEGAQSEFLVWQSPDRLGGYVQSANQRSYAYILPGAAGPVEYQTKPLAVNASTAHLVFYRQAANSPASAADPTRNYLQAVAQAKHITSSGNTYSFTLTQASSTGAPVAIKFVFTVNGPYVSEVDLTEPGASVQLDISGVGSSPPVKLPAGARIVVAPSTTSPGT